MGSPPHRHHHRVVSPGHLKHDQDPLAVETAADTPPRGKLVLLIPVPKPPVFLPHGRVQPSDARRGAPVGAVVRLELAVRAYALYRKGAILDDRGPVPHPGRCSHPTGFARPRGPTSSRRREFRMESRNLKLARQELLPGWAPFLACRSGPATELWAALGRPNAGSTTETYGILQVVMFRVDVGGEPQTPVSLPGATKRWKSPEQHAPGATL